MTVPFLDLHAAYLELSKELDGALTRVARSGSYVLGPEVAAFESAFAELVGVTHCVGVASGLDALQLALLAMAIRPGDEVIVPSNTYIATWFAVSNTGAVPVPVEPDEGTYNLAVDRLEAALTPRTRAIIPVHLYGQPADMAAVRAFADASGLRVLEDAAQAHGARYRGTRVGGLGDAAAWSFYPAKNLGAMGDGGAVTTNDADLAERVRVLANHGSPRKHVHAVVGVNSRLDEMQAAVLRVKLRTLDEWNVRRLGVARRYLDGLRETGLVLPEVPSWAEPVWHLFVVRSRERDALQCELERRGVATMVHYPVPPHRHGAYRSSPRRYELPVTDMIHGQVLSLPMGPHLAASQVDAVIDAVIDAAPAAARTHGP